MEMTNPKDPYREPAGGYAAATRPKESCDVGWGRMYGIPETVSVAGDEPFPGRPSNAPLDVLVAAKETPVPDNFKIPTVEEFRREIGTDVERLDELAREIIEALFADMRKNAADPRWLKLNGTVMLNDFPDALRIRVHELIKPFGWALRTQYTPRSTFVPHAYTVEIAPAVPQGADKP